MFNIFRRKDSQDVRSKPGRVFAFLLRSDDASFVREIEKLFLSLDAATRAHVIVAYCNLIPGISATYMEYKKQGKNYTIEDFIMMASEKLDKRIDDEVNSRRWTWFLYAALLARLEKLNRRDPSVADVGAAIWCDLVEETPRLKALLPNNAVWKPEEKEWFILSMSDTQMIKSTIDNTVPISFAKHTRMQTYAHAKGFRSQPSEPRIGIVP